jgi:cystathionine beta-synthase
MAIYSNALDLIGNTPIVEVTRFDTGKCRLFLKLENQNPGGSIKDRIALSMIEEAERSGKLKPGGLLVEATAGNTGIGLALVAKLKGYRLLLVIPDKMSREKISHLKALGAEIFITRSDVEKGHPEYYQDLAERLSKERSGYYINQFENAANPLAHETGTGPEIWSQMNHNLDAVVVGVGSSGTITGLSRFFKKVAPHVEMILADPEGSILAEYVNKGKVTSKPGSWIVEGIGEDFIPPISDFTGTKKAYSIPDRESLLSARELLDREGILAGSSTGTLLAAALRYCREQEQPKTVLSFVCDSGNKYLSKMFNDYWMIDQGFLPSDSTGTLLDLVARKYRDGGVITIGKSDTLNTAYARMKLYDISQLPVLEDGKLIGLLDESDLLFFLANNKDGFLDTVKSAMNTNLSKIHPESSISDLVQFFRSGFVAIVEDKEGKFLGLITQIDLINHLRRQFKEG